MWMSITGCWVYPYYIACHCTLEPQIRVYGRYYTTFYRITVEKEDIMFEFLGITGLLLGIIAGRISYNALKRKGKIK